MLKKSLRRNISALLCAALSCGVLTLTAGCGGSSGAGDRTVIKFWPSVNQYTTKSMKELVDNYNDGQGKTDGVFVVADLTKTDVSTNHYSICPENVKNQTDLLSVSDRYLYAGANNSAGSYYTDLSALYNDEKLRTKNKNGEYVLDLKNIVPANLSRFYFNRENGEAGNTETGTLYAIPNSENPTMLMYNQSYFEAADINIISVSEEELDDYNKKNGTTFAPRGYCEYTEDATPKNGLKTSENIDGETVVKVFNNLIPMNNIELNTLSKNFTKTYNEDSQSDYGVLNEWWFSHCWPVGGNCVAWNSSETQFNFTLGDSTPGYFVTKDVTVNNVKYGAGEVLGYNARKYVSENKPADIMSSLYEIPSTYKQFREFCALSQKADAKVDSEMYGYAISPDPNSFSNSSKIKYFTSGQVAMLVESSSNLNTIVNSTKSKINVAPLYTFREFEGEGQDASAELKIVGKSYNGVTFEGKLKEVNGVKIESNPVGSSVNIAYAIPANSTKKEAAFKFLQYLCSADGQKYMLSGNGEAPSDINLLKSKDYSELKNRIVDNYAGIAIMAENCKMGDWSYLGDKEWITDWSVDLNNDVRNGVMTLDKFFEKWEPKVNGTSNYNKSLKQDKYKKIKLIELQK